MGQTGGEAAIPYVPFLVAIVSVIIIAIIVAKMRRIFELVPAGGVIAAICFFLPWVKINCMGEVKRASAADLGGNLWIVFAASLLIILVSVLWRHRNHFTKLKSVTIPASLIGLAVMIYALVKIYQGQETELGRISAADLNLSIEFGAVGSMIGLLLALVASVMLKAAEPASNVSEPELQTPEPELSAPGPESNVSEPGVKAPEPESGEQ